MTNVMNNVEGASPRAVLQLSDCIQQSQPPIPDLKHVYIKLDFYQQFFNDTDYYKKSQKVMQ